jgi:hypothetical protein
LILCSAASCPGDIREECIRRIAEVNGQVPTIAFEAKDAAGRRLDTVRLTMDDELLTQQLDQTPLSIDPGEHTFTFESSGQPRMQRRIVVRQGETGRHVQITFESPLDSRPATVPLVSTPQPSDADRSRALGPQRIAALAAGGIGVVGLAVGAVFGVPS